MSGSPESRSEAIKRYALSIGFSSCGICGLEATPHGDMLDRWLREGMAGTMRYMHRQATRRKNPSKILEGARHAVMVTRDYGGGNDPEGRGGRVARYARGTDYHDTLARPLEQLASFIEELGGEGTSTRTFVDAGPVPERELAQRAGLGWIGKNTMLINPRRGSWFFIASVFTDLDLATDDPFEADHCGSCTRCLDACPTSAFTEPRLLDSRRCISYLTIEHRGEIQEDFRPLMADWLFGCDICQSACPWNEKFGRPVEDPCLELDEELSRILPEELLGSTEDEFERKWGHTPLSRPGFAGMRRNAAVVRANLEAKE